LIGDKLAGIKEAMESGTQPHDAMLTVFEKFSYRWNMDDTPFPKACFVDVANDQRGDELSFLRE
jgi:hypothetical protein